MLHPSYSELMDKINQAVEPGEVPVVNSRYSIVLAAAKRARQIVAKHGSSAEPDEKVLKPLSRAVSELYDGSVSIMTDEEFETEMARLLEEAEKEAELKEQMQAAESDAALNSGEGKESAEVGDEDYDDGEDDDEDDAEDSEDSDTEE
ncbi:MAG: DNA-directed RNA polymerase subunit omega [Lachnospiraceae bacterium]|nr:DNA-directed RNA polymerase subunit omega [Lachnospiraceae bacterium]